MAFDIKNFLPYYPSIDDNEFNFLLNAKKEFRDSRIPSTEQFPGVKGGLFKHQVLVSRLLSSTTPYDHMLLMHEMGTGKTCSAIAIIEQLMNENNGIDRFIYVTKNKPLLSNFENEFRGKCTTADFSNVKHIKGLRLYTYGDFLKSYMSEAPSRRIVKKIENSIVIIDEIHNIRDSKSDTYDWFSKLLHDTVNSKIVLLSGTPITDSPYEFASVMNLILPEDKMLPSRETDFNKLFVSEEGELQNTHLIRSAVKGRISYIKSMQSDVKKQYMGSVLDGFKHFILDPSIMGPEQTAVYKLAIQEDSKPPLSPAYKNALQASDFVDVNGTYGVDVKTSSFISVRGTNEEKIKHLSKYSSKYAASISTILRARELKKSVFVFNKHISGGGLAMFARILQDFGFNRVEKDRIQNVKPNQSVNRFILLTGHTDDNNVLIDRFNKPDNVNGNVISVVLASDAVSEGYSFNNIQVIDIHSPWFNFAKTSQAIARGIRVGSHKELLSGNVVNVEIYLRVSIPSDKSISMDNATYKTAENKDIIIKQIERVIKEESIDSRLAKGRNQRSSIAYNGSRECDYVQCRYKSYPTEPKRDSIPIDYSTCYNYNKENKELSREIIDIFKRKNILNGLDIRKLLLNYETYDIIYTLYTLITTDVHIRTNPICFLREQNGFYFIVENKSNKVSLLDMYYVDNKIETKISRVETTMENISLGSPTSVLELNKTLISMSSVSIEKALEKHIDNPENIYISERFKGFYGRIEGVYYSWYLASQGDGPVRYKNMEGIWLNDKTGDYSDIVKKYLKNIEENIERKAIEVFGARDVGFYGIIEYTNEHRVGRLPFNFLLYKMINETDDNRKKPKGKSCTSWTGEGRQTLSHILTSLKIEEDKKNTNTVMCARILQGMKNKGLVIIKVDTNKFPAKNWFVAVDILQRWFRQSLKKNKD
uniref:Helicase ATP-binding domain-containing protein n=1 Tax=viral metagenome TaxID=1070528 RepID=A0A6C0LWH3_9ZZZZ